LRETFTNTNDIDIGDVDNDGKPEILLATSGWGFYELRAYQYLGKKPYFRLKAKKQLGQVSGCKIIDTQKNGNKEIVVTKQYTLDKKVFPNTYGQPDGVYFFQLNANEFQLTAEKICPVYENTKHFFPKIKIGKTANNEFVVLEYNGIKTVSSGSIEEKQEKQEMWICFPKNKTHEWISFTREKKIINYGLGDVDGDGEDELLILEPGTLLIYGIKAN
jgi:hypothetical protein